MIEESIKEMHAQSIKTKLALANQKIHANECLSWNQRSSSIKSVSRPARDYTTLTVNLVMRVNGMWAIGQLAGGENEFSGAVKVQKNFRA